MDWSLFDIVGLDYYSYHANRAGHTKELAPFRRWGKPIMILEFGCCTFTGAADHLATMLDVFTAEGFLGASPYTFISPDAPHRPHDHPHDEDIAAFSLCKVIRKNSDDPASPYDWQPKESFRAVSRFCLVH